MNKLSPLMDRLVRILNQHGHVDPIRDGAKSATIVALINRGILRPSNRCHGPFFPATTRAQVEGEAYAEYDRRAAEEKAVLTDPERWVQVDEGGTVRHTRWTRAGYQIEIEQDGHRFWYVRVNGHTPITAGGDFEEARRAADRFESGQAWGAAHDEYREVTREARKTDADSYARQLTAGIKTQQAVPAAAQALAGTFGGTTVTPADALPTPAAQAVAFEVGDLVQRVGEQGPDAPTGKVLEVRDWPIVGTLVKVTFEGTAAVQKQAGELVKIDKAPAWSNFVEVETDEQRAARHALSAPLIEAFNDLREQHAAFHAGSDIAAEVAAARDAIASIGTITDSLARHLIAQHLDRIAALVPQRATDGDGWGMWLHACGHAQSARRGDGICDGCGGGMAEGWRELYTVAGR